MPYIILDLEAAHLSAIPDNAANKNYASNKTGHAVRVLWCQPAKSDSTRLPSYRLTRSWVNRPVFWTIFHVELWKQSSTRISNSIHMDIFSIKTISRSISCGDLAKSQCFPGASRRKDLSRNEGGVLRRPQRIPNDLSKLMLKPQLKRWSIPRNDEVSRMKRRYLLRGSSWSTGDSERTRSTP